MVISNLSMFQTNTPLTYCVGIDKEKGLRKALAQNRCFVSHFYSFVFRLNFIHSIKALHKLYFCGAFCLNMLET